MKLHGWNPTATACRKASLRRLDPAHQARTRRAYASRDEAVTKPVLLPYRIGSSAHTVVSGSSPSSARTPQCNERRATMPSPRPPIAQFVGSFTAGVVGPPPSLTSTSTLSCSSFHETLTTHPGRGLACLRALLISSLITSPASQAVAS